MFKGWYSSCNLYKNKCIYIPVTELKKDKLMLKKVNPVCLQQTFTLKIHVVCTWSFKRNFVGFVFLARQNLGGFTCGHWQ